MYKKLTIFLALLLWACAALPQQLPQRHKPDSLVNDFANLLSQQEKHQLEQKLVAYDDSTSTQIAVVIVHTVGSNDIAEFGRELGHEWKVGDKDKNNGIVLLVALDDRKVTIQTGYGAEAPVPDITARQVEQDDITPNFRQKAYYTGLDQATSDLMKYMSGEYKAGKHRGGGDDNGGGYFVLAFVIIIMLLIIFRGRGGGGQIIGGRGGASPFWWFLGGAMLGRGSGGWGGFSDGGGGFGGGGGDGGGFGGFGGGDFGGGGASGSW